MLFDLDSMHSYVSLVFTIKFGRDLSKLDHEFIVGMLIGDSPMVGYAYKSCTVLVEGRKILKDLMVLEIYDLDMIMGMD